MTTAEIWDHLIKTAETIAAIAGAFMYKDWRDKKRSVRGDDVSDDYDRKRQILPILEDVRYELEADRVQEWVFSNGDTTLSGHHLKKISIFVETNRDGFHDVAHHLQFVPTKKFERWLDSLHEAREDYIVTREDLYRDELSALAEQYQINTALLIKIKNDLGKWVGVLSVCFSRERSLTDGEVAISKLLAARIGQIK